MSIKSRLEDAIILFTLGRPEGALLSMLTAISATSRRRYPRGTNSKLNPGKEMRDGEAFKTFLKDEMTTICRVANFNVQYRGTLHPIEHIFYKWLRCELAHEAGLPSDLAFEPSTKLGSISVKCDDATGLVLSHGWIDGFAKAVVNAPENADHFGKPPQLPLPIALPKADLTIGSAMMANQNSQELNTTAKTSK